MYLREVKALSPDCTTDKYCWNGDPGSYNVLQRSCYFYIPMFSLFWNRTLILCYFLSSPRIYTMHLISYTFILFPTSRRICHRVLWI